jgi:hypothetical protein
MQLESAVKTNLNTSLALACEQAEWQTRAHE